MTRLGELFSVAYGNKFDMNKMKVVSREDGVAFVGRIGGLNGRSGVAGFVSKVDGVDPYSSGLVTVALGGSKLLSAYVQQQPFYTAQNVAVLTPKNPDMSVLHRLYYAMCIRANAFRYSAFGREANRTLSSIELPDSPPDWVDTKVIPSHDGSATAVATRQALSAEGTWGSFRLDELFTLKKGKRVTKADRLPGTTRFIGASDKNNGVTDMCSLDPIFEAGTLTVPYNGSVGYAFYQDEPYFASDDVQVLVPKKPTNKWALLFVASMIRYEKDRFTYGYKWNLARMKQTTIKLPTDGDQPDWQYMEDYMKGLPFSSAIADSVPEEGVA